MTKELLKHLRIKVSTKPLAKGGSSFETNVLTETTSSKLEFKPTTGFAVFSGVFTLVPIIFIAIGIFQYNKLQNFSFLYNNPFIVFFAFVFTAAPIFLLYKYFSPIVFDKTINRYYKGFYKDKTRNSKNNISLSKIIALQIIGETVASDNSNYHSFELNLVLDNAKRINVIDHSNLKGIIQDAERLSVFLDIPIWHAESNKT